MILSVQFILFYLTTLYFGEQLNLPGSASAHFLDSSEHIYIALIYSVLICFAAKAWKYSVCCDVGAELAKSSYFHSVVWKFYNPALRILSSFYDKTRSPRWPIAFPFQQVERSAAALWHHTRIIEAPRSDRIFNCRFRSTNYVSRYNISGDSWQSSWFWSVFRGVPNIYGCVCVYIYIYIYVCVCVCVYMCIYIYMCVCVCIYMFVCVCICVYTYVCWSKKDITNFTVIWADFGNIIDDDIFVNCNWVVTRWQ